MRKIRWDDLDQSGQDQVLSRPFKDAQNRAQELTQSILDDVKRNGDKALYDLTARYDDVLLKTLKVTQDDIALASKKVDSEVLKALDLAISRVTRYHKRCFPDSKRFDDQDGVYCEQIVRPIQRIGLYVPGGTAPLISTLMMLAIPAQIAGCPVRVLCTPPDSSGTINSHLLLAAKRCGITDIFKVGGAQAIAAMAYGTESIPQVNKIYGPGNHWVTMAKLLVAQDPSGVSIDLPAGPSEVMVIADRYANPVFVASDLLAQAEHSPDAQVIFITDCPNLLDAVDAEIKVQLKKLSRQSILTESLQRSSLILVKQIDQAFDICNAYAPEHLILQLKKPRSYLPYVQCAGAIFLGDLTPEALGDYLTGSNHVLPTGGWAKSYSGLSVRDYVNYMSVQEVTMTGLKNIGKAAMTLAQVEGLDAHKAAVRKRLDSLVEYYE